LVSDLAYERFNGERVALTVFQALDEARRRSTAGSAIASNSHQPLHTTTKRSTLKVLLFTKDRPLQCDGYLDSLLALSDVDPHQISVILPSRDGYRITIDEPKYAGVNWIEESENLGFDGALRKWVENLADDDMVLFGCDDCVFIRPFVSSDAVAFLQSRSKCLAFSLRLGRNIGPAIPLDGRGAIAEWSWRNQPSHWGYPFELMGTIYRANLVKEITAAHGGMMKCPNHYEDHGNGYCCGNKYHDFPIMAMFDTDNYLVAQDVNRVQDYYLNPVRGGAEHAPDHLNEVYAHGSRLDWRRLTGITPTDLFVADAFWKLCDRRELNAT